MIKINWWLPCIIIRVPRLWGTYRGFTFWPFILVTTLDNRTLIEHELIHIRQQLAGLLIIFYIKYLFYHFTVGYRNNPYEVEAYAHQDDWKKTLE